MTYINIAVLPEVEDRPTFNDSKDIPAIDLLQKYNQQSVRVQFSARSRDEAAEAAEYFEALAAAATEAAEWCKGKAG